jgi:hypothetical protein
MMYSPIVLPYFSVSDNAEYLISSWSIMFKSEIMSRFHVGMDRRFLDKVLYIADNSIIP